MRFENEDEEDKETRGSRKTTGGKHKHRNTSKVSSKYKLQRQTEKKPNHEKHLFVFGEKAKSQEK